MRLHVNWLLSLWFVLLVLLVSLALWQAPQVQLQQRIVAMPSSLLANWFDKWQQLNVVALPEVNQVEPPNGLLVTTTPGGAYVQILNIKPKYQPHMQLADGRYQLQVSHPDYGSYRLWIDYQAPGNNVHIDLRQ